MRCVAPSCCAYQSPSPRISRPSASVLMTSTVLPLAPVRTSPGFMALAARHVLGGRHDADDADRRLEQRDGAHGADDGGAARHVVLHPLHAFGRLDRDAAGVERDALADQSQDRRLRRARRLVAHHDHARRLDAAARDAEQQPHPERSICLLVEDLDADAGGACAIVGGALGEDARRQHVRRLVREAPCEIARLAEDLAALDGRLERRASPVVPGATTARSAAGGPKRSPVLYWSTLNPASTSPSVIAWAASRAGIGPRNRNATRGMRRPRAISAAGRRDLAKALGVEVRRPFRPRRARPARAPAGRRSRGHESSYSRPLNLARRRRARTSPPVALSIAGQRLGHRFRRRMQGRPAGRCRRVAGSSVTRRTMDEDALKGIRAGL